VKLVAAAIEGSAAAAAVVAVVGAAIEGDEGAAVARSMRRSLKRYSCMLA